MIRNKNPKFCSWNCENRDSMSVVGTRTLASLFSTGIHTTQCMFTTHDHNATKSSTEMSKNYFAAARKFFPKN